MLNWPKWREGEKREAVGNEQIVVQDPTTGAVIGEAKTPEEAAQMLRDNAQDWQEAA